MHYTTVPTPQYPATIDALQSQQHWLVDIAEQLADAAARTDSRRLSCATSYVLVAIGNLHDAAETLAMAVAS